MFFSNGSFHIVNSTMQEHSDFDLSREDISICENLEKDKNFKSGSRKTKKSCFSV